MGTLGFSIVLPFLVFLVTRWGGNALIYGIMGATYSFFQLIGAPILGRWSDTYGRRKILLLSQLGTLLSWVVFVTAFFLPDEPFLTVDSVTGGSFVLTLPLIVLFVARAADGITGGNVSVANAYLADITSESERNASFGRMAVSSNLGFIFGPMLAGLLGATVLGELLPVLAALFISLVATLLVLFKLPESNPCVLPPDLEQTSVRKIFGQEPQNCFRASGAASMSMGEILKLPGISLLMAMYFLVMLGFNFFYIAFPVSAAGRLQWSVIETGTFFAFMALMMVVIQGPVLTWLARKVSEIRLLAVGSLILAGSFVCFLSDETAVLYLGAALLALGNGLSWPSLMTILSTTAGVSHQGAVQGFAASTGAVASIIGLVAGGLLYTQIYQGIFLVSAGAIGVVFLLSFFITHDSSGGRNA